MTRKLVKVAEYAKLRNVSKVAVYTAIKNGRLDGARNGDGLIDVEIADRLWVENADPRKGGKVVKGEPKIAQSFRLGEGRPTLTESKTLEAEYKAQLARIEFEEKSGKLVDAEKVKKEAFKLARLTRDALLAIPDRLSAELAGITDPFVVHEKIMTEIRGAISEISKVADDE